MRVRGTSRPPQRLYRDVADSVTLIYVARSPEAIALDGGNAQGLVATREPGLFVFRTDEFALFVQALGLDEDPMSVSRLQRGTLGWATAVAGGCLQAAANGSCVRDSWTAWRRLSRQSLAEIIVDALPCAPPIVAAEFTTRDRR